LLLLNCLERFEPGHVDTLKQRAAILGASGRTLEALKTLAVIKTRVVDVEYLLAEIRTQMPAALAALLPGNVAILNAALSCNGALGRQEQVQKYTSALHAIDSSNTPAQVAEHSSAAASAKAGRAKKRIKA
jgi:hypothetical protein